MPTCSRCRREVECGRQWCPHCGARVESAGAKVVKGGRRLLTILAVSIVGAGLVVAGYWWIELRPRMKRLEDPMWGNEPSRERRLAVETYATEWFDREMRLPAGPIGAAWDGSRFVVGNREDPWGFFRIRPEEEDWMLQTVPVVETEYAQRMDLFGVTWNGESIVGLASGAWFRKNDTVVFTIHDPSTLQVTKVIPAPAHTGAIAWDGTNYWIASRRNTRDADEPARLARLDASFAETGSWDPPGVGCQGLAWDGSLLWFTDVFDQSLIAIDVRPDQPVEVHEQHVGSYPSGVVWDGSHLWVADYDGNRLRRVRREKHVAWSGGRAPPAASSVASAAPPPASGDEIAELHDQLRSDDWVVRMRAESRLRELGESIPFARFTNSFRKDDAPDKADLDELVVEIRGRDLVASWDLYIGERYFSSEPTGGDGAISMPLFVRYEVGVDSDEAGVDFEKEFRPLSSGRIREQNVVLASDIAPGRYMVNVFIHIQYVDPEEGPKILNLNEDFVTVEFR